MDEIINYRDLDECEKVQCLDELLKTSFRYPDENAKDIKAEMDKSKEGPLPQFVFVRRDKKVIGYMFLIAEKENTSKFSRGGLLIILMSFPLKQICAFCGMGSVFAPRRDA